MKEVKGGRKEGRKERTKEVKEGRKPKNEIIKVRATLKRKTRRKK